MGKEMEVFPAKWLDWRPPSECWDFGIGELLATALPALFATDASIAAGGTLLPTLGASALGGALPGAALGAGESALTGGKPLIGALTGGLTGGAIGGAGSIAGDLGISPTLAKTVAGGATGLLGSKLTGQNPVIGGLGGAGAGLTSGLLSDGTAAAPGSTGGGPVASAPAAGPAVPSAAPTSAALLSSDTSSFFDGGGGRTGTGTLLGSVGEPSNIAGNIGNATGNAATGGGGGTLATGTGPTSATSNSTTPQTSWLSDTLGTSGKTDIGSRIVNYLGDNPALPIGAGILGTSLFMGSGELPQSGALKANAAGLTRLGNSEVQGLQTGQVPAGAQTLLNQTKSALDAKTRSTYAGLGLSGSTMEAQALNQNAQQVEASKWGIISDLLKQGTSTLKDASQIDYQLMLQEIAKDQRTQDAIGRFAAALAGGSGTTRKTT